MLSRNITVTAKDKIIQKYNASVAAKYKHHNFGWDEMNKLNPVKIKRFQILRHSQLKAKIFQHF